ncbi:MAG: hypothetical protein IT581_23625 [Verrucomicrobiales bacterium]|nr:hypothetical protein [Verrucomicrobiales bacterium]
MTGSCTLRFLDRLPGGTWGRFVGAWWVGLMLSWSAVGEPFALRRDDVAVFLGGSLMVAVERSAAVETLCTLARPDLKVRFRSLAWEGDTVDGQPRDVNFPSSAEWLKRVGATVVFLSFGQAECLRGEAGLTAFRSDYETQLKAIQAVVPRVVLVIPPPFESKAPPMPDLGLRNADLTRYAAATRELATARGIPVLDLLSTFERDRPGGSWTTDGRELSEGGHRWLARVWVRELVSAEWSERASAPGLWEREELRQLRAAVVAKNRLWFRYWRPTNWAFLSGDRTEQLSSRDHRDPKVRWFPAEMEQYPPLIEEAEVRVESLATQAASIP